MESYFGEFWLTRLIFQRAMAAIYVIAFVVALKQFPALLGEKGLEPTPDFLKEARFWEAPSVFHWHYSDRLLRIIAWAGIAISAVALLGGIDHCSLGLSITVWLLLWALYLSIVNVGQTFYSFGWESMLLEAGFFTAFLGPAPIEPSLIPILILRWMLFRTELGAGLIKLRHDRCWRDLTCMYYHYETQPMPNPLSWHFHRLPKFVHRFAVLFSHFVQLLVPFGLFAPQPVASYAAGIAILHQLMLIVSGNYSWLNWLTVVLGFTALSDKALTPLIPLRIAQTISRPEYFDILLYVLGGATVLLSIQPVLNLFSSNQSMNQNYNPLHLVNAYGAFGSVTKIRYELIIEGTADPVITDATRWQEYEFKGKPGDPRRRPPQIAPYHLRLDWLMWFLPFSVTVNSDSSRIYSAGYSFWFMRFIAKLLEGDRKVLGLLRNNPFPQNPPIFVRALFCRYWHTDLKERRRTGTWWLRTPIAAYLRPISLKMFAERFPSALWQSPSGFQGISETIRSYSVSVNARKVSVCTFPSEATARQAFTMVSSSGAFATNRVSKRPIKA